MKGKVVTAIAAVLAAAAAAAGGYVFCTQITIDGGNELYALIPMYIILIFLCAFLDEIIHEGAHFLVGGICSMGVKAPKIRVFKSSSIDVYPRGAKCLKARFILTAGAGLFFDLLIIALGVIAIAVPSVHPVFCLPLPYALYSFIINIMPFEYGSGKTDCLVIVEALSNSESSKVMFGILKIQGLVNGGLPLKEVPENLFLDLPQLPEDDINFIILTQLRYEYYLAVGNDSEAYKYFLRYKDLIKYLPSEYGAEATVRRKVEAEQDVEEEPAADLADIAKKGKRGNARLKKKGKEEAAPAPAPAEPAEEAAGEATEATEQTEEAKPEEDKKD